jgi:hypothetical protein
LTAHVFNCLFGITQWAIPATQMHLRQSLKRLCPWIAVHLKGLQINADASKGWAEGYISNLNVIH